MKNVQFFLSISILFSTQALAQRKTENIILITMDGFRWQELFQGVDPKIINNPKFKKDIITGMNFKEHGQREDLLPFFWGTVATHGQLYGNRKLKSFVNCANPYWFSYPGYHEMFVGAVNRKVRSNQKLVNPNSTVLDFVSLRPGFKNRVSAFSTWDVFPYILRESINGISVNSGVELAIGDSLSEQEKILNQIQTKTRKRSDSVTFHLAFEYLKRERPRLLYIALDETDEYAHQGLYDQYLYAAQRSDQWISKLWAWIQSQPDYSDHTTLLISTDHGRGRNSRKNWRNHGRLTFGSDEIWMAVLGPDTQALGEMNTAQLYQKQLAKTLAAFLGENYQNEFAVGEPVGSMIRPITLIAEGKKQLILKKK